MHNADEPLDADLRVALETLDYPVREVSAESILQEARSRTRRRRVRLAAAAVVMLSAIGVAAMPGSPVRRWVVAAFRGASEQKAKAETPKRESFPPVPEMRGVSAVAAESAVVSFNAWQDTGYVVIHFRPTSELRVESSDSTATYQVRPDGILIDNSGSRATSSRGSNFALDVANSVRSLRVLVRSQTIFERRDGVVVLGPSPAPSGGYFVSLSEQAKR